MCVSGGGDKKPLAWLITSNEQITPEKTPSKHLSQFMKQVKVKQVFPRWS